MASLSSLIDELSIHIQAQAHQAEAVASHASYVGSERQVNNLLTIALELRLLSIKAKALHGQ